MGSKDKSIVVQNRLSHFHSQRSSFFCVKSSAHLGFQLFQSVTVISPSVVGGRIQAVGGKEVFRISCRCADKGAGVDVPLAGFNNIQMICRTVYFNVNANLSQSCLNAFCQKGSS